MDGWKKKKSIKCLKHKRCLYNSIKAFILAVDLEVQGRNIGTKYWLLSEALTLMVRKKSLGENSGPVQPMKTSAFITYDSINSCVSLLEFLLIIKSQRPAEWQKIKCIKVHFMLCIHTLMAGSQEFITWLLQRTE